jgi:hypothetical protein
MGISRRIQYCLDDVFLPDDVVLEIRRREQLSQLKKVWWDIHFARHDC